MEFDTLRWVWLLVGLALLGAEFATASLLLLPLAIGAFAASIAAFAGGGIALQLVIAAGVSAVAFMALRPIARRVSEIPNPEGAGAHRLLGARGVVTVATNDFGEARVSVGGEEWPAAESVGRRLPAGVDVTVQEVRGAHLVVSVVDRQPWGTTGKEI
jgi:membrane protein implicated in regulation of membrane protease activity